MSYIMNGCLYVTRPEDTGNIIKIKLRYVFIFTVERYCELNTIIPATGLLVVVSR